MKESLRQVEANLEASKGGKSEKRKEQHKELQQKSSDLAFKQSQFDNAESTLQRVQLELNERKQDLERVEELERKMNQEMDNLNQKMLEMREEIKMFENIDALKQRAEQEK